MKNNYWHIQLHPDDKLDIDTIKSILTTKQVIGMGESWNDKNGAVFFFFLGVVGLQGKNLFPRTFKCALVD